MTEILWRKRARSLKKARKAFRAGDPEGLHDLRVALRRTAATAEALGKKKIVRGRGSTWLVTSPAEPSRTVLPTCGPAGVECKQYRSAGTTGGSASASELIINGLRPYMPVTVVGSTTHGKPVGQLTYNFCDKVLYAVAFKSTNALGQGDYFDGIPPDCAAPDDLDHQLGDGAEASLGAALQYVRTGACSASAAAQARAQAERRPAVGRAILEGSGWPVLLPR